MSAKGILCKQLNTALGEHFHENQFISFLGSIGIIDSIGIQSITLLCMLNSNY